MTWHETHRRWQALREIEEAADRDPTGALPWRDDYAEIFGSRDGLLSALRYRWQLTREAQLDIHLPEDDLAEARRELTARNAGILRILARYPARAPEGHLVHAS